MRRHAPVARAVARRILQNDGDADEAVQEAFVNAHRQLSSFREQASFSTWLRRIATNQALMKLRARRRHPVTSIESLLPAFQEDGHHHEPVGRFAPVTCDAERLARRDALRRAVAQLPDNYRQVVVLRCVEELDTEETATLLEISKTAVKLRLHRAHQALRGLLAEDFERKP